MTLTEYTAMVRKVLAQADRGIITEGELQQKLLLLAVDLLNPAEDGAA